jgi:two-component SAPR family response regulator
LRVLIVEQDAWASLRLVRLVSEHADLEVIGALSDWDEALGVLTRNCAEIVFVDSNIVAYSSIDRAGPAGVKVWVLMTGSGQDAFARNEAPATRVLVLLKPFDRTRLEQVIAKIRQILLKSPIADS